MLYAHIGTERMKKGWTLAKLDDGRSILLEYTRQQTTIVREARPTDLHKIKAFLVDTEKGKSWL